MERKRQRIHRRREGGKEREGTDIGKRVGKMQERRDRRRKGEEVERGGERDEGHRGEETKKGRNIGGETYGRLRKETERNIQKGRDREEREGKKQRVRQREKDRGERHRGRETEGRGIEGEAY
jgi:hypothetical protein